MDKKFILIMAIFVTTLFVAMDHEDAKLEEEKKNRDFIVREYDTDGTATNAGYVDTYIITDKETNQEYIFVCGEDAGGLTPRLGSEDN